MTFSDAVGNVNPKNMMMIKRNMFIDDVKKKKKKKKDIIKGTE